VLRSSRPQPPTFHRDFADARGEPTVSARRGARTWAPWLVRARGRAPTRASRPAGWTMPPRPWSRSPRTCRPTSRPMATGFEVSAGGDGNPGWQPTVAIPPTVAGPRRRITDVRRARAETPVPRPAGPKPPSGPPASNPVSPPASNSNRRFAAADEGYARGGGVFLMGNTLVRLPSGSSHEAPYEGEICGSAS
jgi:hypothetical protein